MKKIYKTIVTIEVLSEEPIDVSLKTIVKEIDNGNFSGLSKIGVSEAIEGIEAIKEACEAQGTDPDFFLGDVDDGYDDVDDMYNDGTRIWSEVRNNFVDNSTVYIDGYTSEDDNEGGKVIARIHLDTNKEVEYVDERAKTDELAQEAIQEVLDNWESYF